MYGPNNIQINMTGSDGTAIGNGNSVTVVKKQEKHVHHHHRPQSSGGGDDGLRALVIAGSVLLTLLLAACGYYFALHADIVYAGLTAMHVTEGVAITLAMLYHVNRTNEWPAPKHLLLMLLTMLSSAGLYLAADTYGTELPQFARASGNLIQFWCGLSTEWRQFALLHVVTAIGGYGLGGVLLFLPVISLGRSALDGDEAPSAVSTWWWIVIAGVLIGGAAFFSTTAEGWATWKSIPVPKPLFCPR